MESLKNEMAEQEYNFIIKNTWQIDSYANDIKKVLEHPNFTFKRERPCWNDLQRAFEEGTVCEVVLDAVTLDEQDGDIVLHRVVILDINDREIIFHDPRTNKSMPIRKEHIELFKKAWLSVLDSPELCIYKK